MHIVRSIRSTNRQNALIDTFINNFLFTFSMSQIPQTIHLKNHYAGASVFTGYDALFGVQQALLQTQPSLFASTIDNAYLFGDTSLKSYMTAYPVSFGYTRYLLGLEIPDWSQRKEYTRLVCIKYNWKQLSTRVDNRSIIFNPWGDVTTFRRVFHDNSGVLSCTNSQLRVCTGPRYAPVLDEKVQLLQQQYSQIFTSTINQIRENPQLNRSKTMLVRSLASVAVQLITMEKSENDCVDFLSPQLPQRHVS
jgi:hypothetical protein